MPQISVVTLAYKSTMPVETLPKITSPDEAAAYLRSIWNDDHLELKEEFIVILLDNMKQVLGWSLISPGGSIATIVDTTSPAGKALQRMLLVFAEFERDMVSERTKEKRLETIKAGLWPGGYQILGYDLEDRKLVINEDEAELVRDIYQRYLKLKSASKVSRSLNKEGFRNKEWITHKGNSFGGGEFHRKSLLTIIKNHTYLGKYEFEGKIYEGKHEQIVDQEIFDQVQTVIHQNAVEPKSNISSDTPAVLTDICTCGFCESGMTVSSTTNRHNKKYYY